MKNVWIVFIVFVGVFSALSVVAEDTATLEFNPQTGDAEFDAILGKFNIEASANIEGFLNNLSVRYNVPEEELEPLIIEEEMTPADVLITLILTEITEEPIPVVVEAYTANRDKGWGFIAKQLGIKPGSEEFHALKQGTLTEFENVQSEEQRPGKSAKPGKGKKANKKE